MDKDNFKKYYCSSCKSYYNEPERYREEGHSTAQNWDKMESRCPRCHNDYMEIKYYCHRCEKFKDNIEFYPYADEYMCDECYGEMMEVGELVENNMEGVIESEEPDGLVKEEVVEL